MSTKFGLLIDFDLLKAAISTNAKPEIVLLQFGRHIALSRWRLNTMLNSVSVFTNSLTPKARQTFSMTRLTSVAVIHCTDFSITCTMYNCHRSCPGHGEGLLAWSWRRSVRRITGTKVVLVMEKVCTTHNRHRSWPGHGEGLLAWSWRSV